jgi:hypothetical protein
MPCVKIQRLDSFTAVHSWLVGITLIFCKITADNKVQTRSLSDSVPEC